VKNGAHFTLRSPERRCTTTFSDERWLSLSLSSLTQLCWIVIGKQRFVSLISLEREREREKCCCTNRIIFFYRERRNSIGVWSCPGADRVGMRVGVRAAVRYLYGQI
jgi:hypothetical protein